MHSLLLQVFRSPWMIEPQTAMASHVALQALLDGKLAFESDPDSFKPIMARSAGRTVNPKANTGGVVAVIPINGVLLKDDQDCGPVGMDSLGRYIRMMDNDPSVDAIMLKIDSPGGTVSGTSQLGEIIKNTNKPIVAFVDDMAASAAYWLASQTDMIIASTRLAEVGSIGVLLQFADMQPAYERLGVKFHEIYSSLSPDKNKAFRDILKGDYEAYTKDVLDPIAQNFVDTVMAARTGKISDETILKGRLEFADKAITTGLIDRIASFDEAIDITLGLVESKPTAKIEIPKPKSLNMNKYTRTAAVVGVPSFEVADGGIFLNEEQVSTIEAALESAEGNRTALEQHTAQATAAQETIAGHIATITERDAAIAQLNTDITALRGAAGAESAIVTAKTDLEKTEEGDPLMAKINATTDPVERMNLMRDAGYAK
jgi:protease-4